MSPRVFCFPKSRINENGNTCILISKIVYTQLCLWKQRFSIQKRVQRTQTLTQIHNVKALANEDTLLRTQMFPVCSRATYVADTNFGSGTQKIFLILFRNSLCLQKMFPSLRSPRNIMSNNVSATMSPRLPGPLQTKNSQQSTDALLIDYSSTFTNAFIWDEKKNAPIQFLHLPW